jgi:hypothetical protein
MGRKNNLCSKEFLREENMPKKGNLNRSPQLFQFLANFGNLNLKNSYCSRSLFSKKCSGQWGPKTAQRVYFQVFTCFEAAKA